MVRFRWLPELTIRSLLVRKLKHLALGSRTDAISLLLLAGDAEPAAKAILLTLEAARVKKCGLRSHRRTLLILVRIGRLLVLY